MDIVLVSSGQDFVEEGFFVFNAGTPVDGKNEENSQLFRVQLHQENQLDYKPCL